jgi:fumarate reductase subunit D
MVLCIVEMVLFVAVGLRFILWLFDAEYMGFGIAGIVCSVIAMVICFIMVMSSYEQSSLRVKKDTETTE